MADEEVQIAEEPEPPKLREIVIETDGASVNLVKADCTPLEARMIFQMLLDQLGG